MANETTASFSVDISELKKNFQEASRQIRLANAEFKASTSSMDDWGNSADGVTAKLSQLDKVLDGQKKQLASLEDQYRLVSEQQGANSKGAEELLIRINNQKAAIGNTEKQIRNYNEKLSEMASASSEVAESGETTASATENLQKNFKDAQREISLANSEFKASTAGMEDWSKSTDGVNAKLKQLKSVLDSQKKQLQSLSQQYALVASEQGESSEEAQELKIQINNQRAAIRTTESEIGSYTSRLEELEEESRRATQQQGQQATAMDNLKGTIANQEKSLSDLKKQYANVVLEQGKNSTEARNLATQIDELSGELNDNREELTEAETAADRFDQTLEETGDDAVEASDGFTVMKGALANLVADGVKLAIDGLKNLGESIVDVGKQSLENYASYEQLVGGVETLFEDSAKTVQKYADNAFKSAGMSANDYMETVTSFSASLLQGLNGDTAKAAKIADQAIVDMSDNANKMGSDMASIQTAYQGFAKQNYTMLDNLKLGYGGTQSEMARLINDSGVLGDEIEITAETVNSVSFDKIIEAIHVVQTEMGITGTTAKEAASTIEGSKGAMESAWTNLLTGLADENANLDVLFDNLVDSVITYGQNILPRIEVLVKNAVGFLKEKLQEYFPEAFETISGIVTTVKEDIYPPLKEFFDLVVTTIKDDILPVLEDVGGWLADNLLPVIGDIIGWIMDNKDAVIAALSGIAAGIMAMNAVTMIQGMISAYKQWKLATEGMTIAQKLLNLAQIANPTGLIIAAVVGLVTAIVVLWNKSEKFRNFVIGMWESIKETVATAVEKIKEVWSTVTEWLSEKWEGIKTKASEIWTSVTDFFVQAGEKIKGIWESIKETFSTIAQWIHDNIFVPIMEFFQPVIQFFSEAWNIIKELAAGTWELIKAVWSVVSTWFDENIIQPVIQFFTNLWDGIKEKASSTWEGIKAVWTLVSTWFNNNIIIPVKNFFHLMWDKIKEGASTAWEKIKEIWGKVSTWFDEKIVTPVKDFFTETWDKVKSGAEDAWDGIKSVFTPVVEWFEEKFTKAWEKVKAVFSTGGKIFDGIKEGITSAFKTVVNAIIRGINKVIAIPFNAINNTLDKLRDISIAGVEPFKNLISRFTVPEIPELAKGGIVSKRTFIAGEDGAEAVIPLEKNTGWLDEIADRLADKINIPTSARYDSGRNTNVVNNFYQTNNSPKSLSRLEIYRQSKNLLRMKGV